MINIIDIYIYDRMYYILYELRNFNFTHTIPLFTYVFSSPQFHQFFSAQPPLPILLCDLFSTKMVLFHLTFHTQMDIVVKKTTTSLTPEVFDYTSQCYLPGSSIFWAFACVGFLAFQLSSFHYSISIIALYIIIPLKV